MPLAFTQEDFVVQRKIIIITGVTYLFRRRCRGRWWSALLGAGVGYGHWRRFACRGRTGRRPYWRESLRVGAGCVRCRIPDHTRDIYNKNSQYFIGVELIPFSVCKDGWKNRLGPIFFLHFLKPFAETFGSLTDLPLATGPWRIHLGPEQGLRPGPGWMGCMILGRTFHTAPEQEQGRIGCTPIFGSWSSFR